MWKPFHTWFVQVAFLLHSHYDLLWQIIHYNRYQQPGLIHLTIFWQDRDKMAPKCDVIVTTVACRSYFWKRETEVTEKPSATKTLRNHWKKKKAVQYLRQESFGVQVQKLAKSHSVINRWINCCWSGVLGRPSGMGWAQGWNEGEGCWQAGESGGFKEPWQPPPRVTWQCAGQPSD